MKTLSVSYNHRDNRREMCTGTIRQRQWQMKWASAAAKACHWCVHFVFYKQEYSERKAKFNPMLCKKWCSVWSFCLGPYILAAALCFIWQCYIAAFFGRAWEERAEDEVLFSGTLGTHLTLAYCWACSTGPEHAEVWIQKCFCAAQATRGEAGVLLIYPQLYHISQDSRV